jgi:hypothetical protein
MDDAGWSEGGIAGIQQGSILTDANHAAAFENEIKLILSAMGVGGVLLTRFERIQTYKKRLALHDRALAHLVRCELRKVDDPFCKHDLKCTGAFSFQRSAGDAGFLRVPWGPSKRAASGSGSFSRSA